MKTARRRPPAWPTLWPLVWPLAAALCLVLSLCTAAWADEALTPGQVSEALAGPQAQAEALRLLAACDAPAPNSRSVCELIAQGRPAWLKVAVQLRQHSDASATTAVCNALARAARRAPRQVLALWQQAPGLDDGCLCLPFISDELPLAEQQAELRASRRAIRQATGHQLQTARQACLGVIDSGLQRVRAAAASAPR